MLHWFAVQVGLWGIIKIKRNQHERIRFIIQKPRRK